MRVSDLTLLILELNAALDTGKYDDIALEPVSRAIERKQVFAFLKANVEDVGNYPRAELQAEISEALYRIWGGYAGNERRKWGVQNRGLCLLIAWVNEIIQQGSGWSPPTK